MEYRLLGRSALSVSALALGTMTFGDSTAQDEAFAQLDAFAEARRHAGRHRGRLHERRRGDDRGQLAGTAPRPRDRTDDRRHQGPVPHQQRPQRPGLLAPPPAPRLGGLPHRLGVEAVDLYQLHGWDPLTPVEETLSFLDEPYGGGEIRYSGLSNFTGWQLQKTADLADARRRERPVAFQVQYNLLVRLPCGSLAGPADRSGPCAMPPTEPRIRRRPSGARAEVPHPRPPPLPERRRFPGPYRFMRQPPDSLLSCAHTGISPPAPRRRADSGGAVRARPGSGGGPSDSATAEVTQHAHHRGE